MSANIRIAWGAAPALTHVVAAGETLFAIARHYGRSPEAIAAMNELLDGGQWIYPGQEIEDPAELGCPIPRQLYIGGRGAAVRPYEWLL